MFENKQGKSKKMLFSEKSKKKIFLIDAETYCRSCVDFRLEKYPG